MGKATTKAESADGTDAVLSARDVTRHFPVMRKGRRLTVRALDDVNLEIGAGEVLGLVGESGCGKSLTSLALMGLLGKSIKRNADRMTFDGTELTTASQGQMRKLRGARMSMIFQEPMTSLNPLHTLEKQLRESLEQRQLVQAPHQLLPRLVRFAARLFWQLPRGAMGQARLRVD